MVYHFDLPLPEIFEKYFEQMLHLGPKNSFDQEPGLITQIFLIRKENAFQRYIIFWVTFRVKQKCFLNFWLSAEVVTRVLSKRFLEISQNSQENTCGRASFLVEKSFLKKETLLQVFSCEFCKIFKNNFFNTTPPVAASFLFNTPREMLKKHRETWTSNGVANYLEIKNMVCTKFCQAKLEKLYKACESLITNLSRGSKRMYFSTCLKKANKIGKSSNETDLMY